MESHDPEDSPLGISSDDLHGNTEDDLQRQGTTLNAAILAFRQHLQENKPNTSDNSTLLGEAGQPPNTNLDALIGPSTCAEEPNEKMDFSARSVLSGLSTQAGGVVRRPQWTPSARVCAMSLHLGYLQSEEMMADMQTVGNSSGFISLEFGSSRKELSLFASFLDAELVKNKKPAPRTYRLRTPLRNMSKIYETREADGAFGLVIALLTPPEVSRRSSTFQWERATNITTNPREASASAIALHQNYLTDFGRWIVYRMVFPKHAEESWAELRESLGVFRVNIQRNSPMQSIRGWSSSLWRWLDESSSSKPQGSLALLESTRDFYFPFKVRYLLEACISLGVLHESGLDNEFLSKLQRASTTSPHGRNKAEDMLEFIAIQGKHYWKPMEIFKDKNVVKYWPARKVPNHCGVVRKVTITPTTIYFSPPTVETTHRLLRKHMHFSDRFLRVQFLDETHKGKIFSKIWEDDYDLQTAIWARIMRACHHGIRVGNRLYRFLAYGNSQLREHGALFYCDEPSLTREMIWHLMGDFSQIRVAAKYAARMGQCLTTTREPRNLSFPANIVNIPDVKKGQWNFSDGVGKIGRNLADEIVKTLKLPSKRNGPSSAFQFRLGGSKGLLVVWDNISWNDVHLRPSQIKFQALDKSLEVIKIARTTTATLNRQTITILSHLGVPDTVFMDMLRTQLCEYNNAMEDTIIAERVLREQSDENEIQATIAGMIANGFMGAQEPFTLAILGLWRAWSLQHLKQKGRLAAKKGAFVFGALDETAILRGHSNGSHKDTLPQIFLQVPEGRQYHVVQGLCIVGRNPTLHPGDIRLVEAVDVPELRHIHDVVIFPAGGDRDIPSMCSGGDLDGDEFFVIWDESLIPPRQEEPGMETAHAVKDLGRDVTIDDVEEFLVDFIKNDSIGVIAHAHLAWADKLGPAHPNCLELASLHSKSVDFNKTGVPAKIRKGLQVRKFPHFMGKSEDRSYRSDSVLGHMYDAVVEVDFLPDYTKPFDSRVLVAYSPDENIMEKAATLKAEYDKSMQAIMRQHSINTEFEVWTTFVLTRPVVGSDFKTQEKIGEVRAALLDQYKMAAYAIFGIRDSEDGSPEIAEVLPIAAACYWVTHKHVQKALQELAESNEEPTHENMPFISFPWIFEHELGMIVRHTPRAEDDTTTAKTGQVTPVIHEAYEETTQPRSPGIDKEWITSSQANEATPVISKAAGELLQPMSDDTGKAGEMEEQESDDEEGGDMESLALKFDYLSFR